MGQFEYYKALENFDALLRMCNSEELQAIEEIVQSSDELVVYTNLSRRLQNGPSSLAEAPQNANDNFARRGLAWIMALARVELGAMLAGFTEHPQPFEAVGPSRYELEAYRELLQDGARSHYWSLANDQQLPIVINGFPPNRHTLAYMRRLNIARHFLIAAAKIGVGGYSAEQRAEMIKQKNQLDGIAAEFTSNIQSFVAAITQTRTANTSRTDQMTLQTCIDGLCQQTLAAGLFNQK